MSVGKIHKSTDGIMMQIYTPYVTGSDISPASSRHEKQWGVTIVYLKTMKSFHAETVNLWVTSVFTG